MSTTLDPSTTAADPGAISAPGRGWVLAGLGAGVLGIVGAITSGMPASWYAVDASKIVVCSPVRWLSVKPPSTSFSSWLREKIWPER